MGIVQRLAVSANMLMEKNSLET